MQYIIIRNSHCKHGAVKSLIEYDRIYLLMMRDKTMNNMYKRLRDKLVLIIMNGPLINSI